MDGVSTRGRTRRLTAPYLSVERTASHTAVPSGVGVLRWVGCHGGAGVSTLVALTRIGQDTGVCWPTADAGEAPAVLVCRATAAGTAAAAAAVEQWQNAAELRHVRLLGLVVVAVGPRPMPSLVKKRLRLLAGWVRRLWFVGWQEAYVVCDDPWLVGPSPAVDELRAHLCGLLKGSRL